MLEPASAVVKVDGRLVALQDGILVTDAGLRDLEISASGYAPMARRVHVAPAATQRVEVDLSGQDARPAPGPTPGPAPNAPAQEGGELGTWKWVTGGTGVAVLGLGVTGLLLSNSAADDWNTAVDATNASCVQANDRSQTWRVVSIAGFVAGGALVALSSVFFILDSESADGAASPCSAGAFEFGLECHARF